MSQYPYVHAALGLVFFLGVFAGDTDYLRRYGHLDSRAVFFTYALKARSDQAGMDRMNGIGSIVYEYSLALEYRWTRCFALFVEHECRCLLWKGLALVFVRFGPGLPFGIVCFV